MPSRKVTPQMHLDFILRIKRGQTPLEIATDYSLDRSTVSGYVRLTPRPYPEAGRPRARCHKTVAELADRLGNKVAAKRHGLSLNAVRYSCKMAREGDS